MTRSKFLVFPSVSLEQRAAKVQKQLKLGWRPWFSASVVKIAKGRTADFEANNQFTSNENFTNSRCGSGRIAWGREPTDKRMPFISTSGSFYPNLRPSSRDSKSFELETVERPRYLGFTLSSGVLRFPSQIGGERIEIGGHRSQGRTRWDVIEAEASLPGYRRRKKVSYRIVTRSGQTTPHPLHYR